MSHSVGSQPRQHMRFFFRAAFILFAIALATATHWPALKIDGPVHRTDLFLHVFAFGLWASLLTLSAFFGPTFATRNVLRSAAISILYAAIDESTQAFPALGRTVSMQDFLANLIGIGGATMLAGIASLSVRRSGGLHGPIAWGLSLLVGLIIGGLASVILPATYADHLEAIAEPAIQPSDTQPAETPLELEPPQLKPEVPLILCAPFALLLLSIAVVPFINERFWHLHFPDFSFFLGGTIVGYYLIAFSAPYEHGFSYGSSQLMHSAHEYFSFIALIGSLYIASAGILIDIKGRSTPLANTALLACGALLANLVGTTGASMLLIRPFMRLNASRLRAIHIIFFIFIVSNCGGALTPIGDPPLYLGYLKGIPFFWTVANLWPMWLLCIGTLLITFFIIDARIPRNAEPPTHTSSIRLRGFTSIIALAAIIAAVFFDPFIHARIPALAHIPFTPFIQIAIAVAAYRTAPRDIIDANEFSFFPIKEVALLFLGIFATMTPALGYLASSGGHIALHTPAEFYFATGALSGVLDNAPTFANFLQLAYGPQHMTRDGILAFVNSTDGARLTTAVALGAVFCGAFTYIGNGPNFMVKAIAERSGVRMPTFFGYILRSLLFLSPAIILVWLVFLR